MLKTQKSLRLRLLKRFTASHRDIAYGIRIQPHTEDAPGWFVQLVNAEGEVLGSAFGDNATDAALSAALELERDLQGAAEPPSPDADI